MFWFWFYVLIIPLMIVLDAAWWVAAMRLTKRRLWRVVVCVFMAGQTAALLLAILGRWWHVDLLGQTPKAVLVAFFICTFSGWAFFCRSESCVFARGWFGASAG